MNKTKNILFFFIIFFWISKLHAIDTNAQQAIIIDYNTDEILFETNTIL